MASSSWVFTHLNWSDASFENGAFNIVSNWKIDVDSPTIGPDEIRRHPNLAIGKSYAARNDRNPSLTLRRVALKQAKPRTRWIASLTYSFDSGTGGNNSNNGQPKPGSSSGDSAQIAPVFSMTTRPFFERREVSNAVFLGVVRQEGGVKTNTGGRLGGKWVSYVGPPLNSALDRVEPRRETTIPGTVIRQTGFWSPTAATSFFDTYSPLQGSMNRSEVTLKNPAGTFQIRCKPFTLRFDSVIIDPHYGNELFIPVVFEWSHLPIGWFEDIPDEGFAVATPAVTSMAGDFVAEIHSDEKLLVTDDRGEAATTPQPFDGQGRLNRRIGEIQFFNRYALDPIVEFPSIGAPYSGAWK